MSHAFLVEIPEANPAIAVLPQYGAKMAREPVWTSFFRAVPIYLRKSSAFLDIGSRYMGGYAAGPEQKRAVQPPMKVRRCPAK